jgi:hypothetical protein
LDDVSFYEFYAMDLNEVIVLLGHDRPGHMGSIIDKLAQLLGVISYRMC